MIVSLAGLWMVDNQALRSMALGAMTVVAVSILTATTLLPALIAMLGDRVLPGGIVARVLALFAGRSKVAPPPPPLAPREREEMAESILSGSGGPRGSWPVPGSR